MPTLRTIARIRAPHSEKFGLPRQSGLVESLTATIIFEPEYRDPQALRGIEGFSHIWLIWGFSASTRDTWSPTVRPPRLGGNARMGVFATRSPFRPNPIGLSAVRLLAVETDPHHGCVLKIAGADLMDGTPIYDIKPYLPYTDCRGDATGGFAGSIPEATLAVEIPEALESQVPQPMRAALRDTLALDPRPAYQDDPERVYAMAFDHLTIRFRVKSGVCTVSEVVKNPGIPTQNRL